MRSEELQGPPSSFSSSPSLSLLCASPSPLFFRAWSVGGGSGERWVERQGCLYFS